MTPITAALLAGLSALLLLGRRRWVIPALIVGMCFIPPLERISIAGVDFFALRVLLFVCCARILLKRDNFALRLNTLDWLCIAWIVVGAVVYVMLRGGFGSVIYTLGVAVDRLLAYFVLRSYIRSSDDVLRSIYWLLGSAVVLAPVALVEQVTGRSPFELMGQAPLQVREGNIRSVGPFSHAILFGSFAAALVPLALGVWYGRASRAATGARHWLPVAGGLAAVYIVFASASSGPVISLVLGGACIYAYRYRHYTARAFYGLLLLLAVLHVVMKAPVWHLISRVDLAGGSTGYHRYLLIDRTISNFSEWALLGVKTVEHWGIHWGDVTSQYILQAVHGGIWQLVLFVWLLIVAGRELLKTSRLRGFSRRERWLYWGLYCSFFSHCLSFISVSYFGQIQMQFMLVLACAGSAWQWRAKEAAWLRSRAEPTNTGDDTPAAGYRPAYGPHS